MSDGLYRQIGGADETAGSVPPLSAPRWLQGHGLAGAALRFGLAGGAASLLNWLVRFPLSLALPFEPAVAAAYTIGMAAGFLLYRAWVFPGSALPMPRQILRFIGVNVVGLATVVLAAQALAPAALLLVPGAPTAALALAHGLAILCGAVVNFSGHRALTFATARAAA